MTDCGILTTVFSPLTRGLLRVSQGMITEKVKATPPKILESNLFTFLRQILHVKACSAISLTLLKAVFICTICTGANLLPGANLHPGENLHP